MYNYISQCYVWIISICDVFLCLFCAYALGYDVTFYPTVFRLLHTFPPSDNVLMKGLHYISFVLILAKLQIMSTLKAEKPDTRDMKREKKKIFWPYFRVSWFKNFQYVSIVCVSFHFVIRKTFSFGFYSLCIVYVCHIILIWMIRIFFFVGSCLFHICSCCFFLCRDSFSVHMHRITVIALTWLCEWYALSERKLNSN